MRISYWAPKATNTRSEYVTLITFPLQKWLDERPSVLRYTYIILLGIFQVLMAMTMASFGIRRHVCVCVCVKVRQYVLFNDGVNF